MWNILKYIHDHCFSSGDGDATRTKLLTGMIYAMHMMDGAKCHWLSALKNFKSLYKSEESLYKKVEVIWKLKGQALLM